MSATDLLTEFGNLLWTKPAKLPSGWQTTCANAKAPGSTQTKPKPERMSLNANC